MNLKAILLCCTTTGTTSTPAPSPVTTDGTMAPAPVAAGTMAPASVANGAVGVCTFVDTVSGEEKEEGQNRLSVQVR